MLLLENDGLTVEYIILVYQTYSLIGYTMKERNCKFRPCHGKSLVEFGRCPRQARRQHPIRRRRCRRSNRLSTPPSCRICHRCTSLSHCLTLGGGGGHEFVVGPSESSHPIPSLVSSIVPMRDDISRTMNLCWSHIETHRVSVRDWLSRGRTNPSDMESHG